MYLEIRNRFFACFRRDQVEERSVVDRTVIASENSHEHARDVLVNAILFDKKLRYDLFIFSRSSALLLISIICSCLDFEMYMNWYHLFSEGNVVTSFVFIFIFGFSTSSKDRFSSRGNKNKCHYFQLKLHTEFFYNDLNLLDDMPLSTVLKLCMQFWRLNLCDIVMSRDVITHNTEDCESRVLMIKRSQK